jgi:hypothetical protein
MTSKPARGPQPVTRADGTTAWSTGPVHTWGIRIADLLRRTAATKTPGRTPPAIETGPAPSGEYEMYRNALRAADNGR